MSSEKLNKNQPRPIDEALIFSLSLEPTDAELLDSIRCWIELLATGEYELAVDAISWRWNEAPEVFRRRVENFFGVENQSQVDHANDDVLKRTEIHREGIPPSFKVVVDFYIPLKNGLGIWTTFIVVQEKSSCIFEFGIFHA